MLSKSRTSKAINFLIVLAFTITSVSAATIQPQGDTNVWLNSEDIPEFNIITEQGEEVTEVSVENGESKVVIANESVNLTTSDFSSEELDYSSYTLKVKNESDMVENQDFQVRGMNIQQDSINNGSGFVGQKMGAVDGTEPLSFTIDTRNVDMESFSTTEFEQSFSVVEPEAEIKSASDVEVTQDGDQLMVEVQPYINEMVSGELSLRYRHKGGVFERGFTPTVYSLRAVPSNDRPPIELDYGRINEFAYNLNIYKNGRPVSNTDVQLYDENFTLEIDGLGSASFDSNADFLEVEAINNENADYRLTLDRVPQLESGQYRFTTKLLTADHPDEGVLIDSIRVNNALRLSGRVQDSQASPIQAKFTLMRGSTEIPITTDSSGTYYKEIGSGNSLEGYNVNMEFFDTTSFSGSSNAQIMANSVDFRGGENRNLAGDSESIKFQYWMDPPVEEKAINAVNMMAVKFAYPMAESGHTASMQYNPANVNPDDLKVYSCSYWNFEGRSCLGEWSEVDQISINHQGSRVNFNIDSPYLAENTGDGNKHILMNAYIVGTSADLMLNNGISISGTDGGRVETNGDVTVSGRIVSENGDFVEGAEVDISFYEGKAETHSFETTSTDSEGRFSVEGDAPSEPGNYTVRLEASADNYDSLDTEFEDRFETFISEGVSVDAESPLEVTLGQETSTIVDVQNTGQTDMQNVELSFSGMSSDFYSVSRKSFSSIPAGESVSTEVTFDIPESYGVDDYPQLDIDVTAENPDGEQFEDDDSIQTQLTYPSGTSSTGSAESKTPDEQQESSSFSTDDVANMTGEFLESQSSLNIALGLILIFLMALAGAMKKKKQEEDDDRRRGGRPTVQKPSLQKQTDRPVEEEDEEEDVDSQIDEIAGAFDDESGEDSDEEVAAQEPEKQAQEEETESAPEEPGQETVAKDEPAEEGEAFKCDVCGEKFDSESGKELHQSVMHE